MSDRRLAHPELVVPALGDTAGNWGLDLSDTEEAKLGFDSEAAAIAWAVENGYEVLPAI